MPYYRLISENDLNNLMKKNCIEPSNQSWPPYEPGEVVFIYECDSSTLIFSTYGDTIAYSRELKVGEFIFVIELSDLSDVKADESQLGWPESRVHFGSIPIEKISIVAESNVIVIKSGRTECNPLVIYDKAKVWSVEENTFVAA